MKVLATVFDTVKKLVRRSRSGDLIEIPGIVAGSASVQALTAASMIAPTAYGIPISSSADIELESEPAIAIATEWQQIILFNAGNYTITFRDVSIQSTSGLSIAGGKLKLKSGTTAAFWFLAGRWCYAGSITTPAPPVNSVQFNDNDAFGGSENLTWDGSQLATNGRVLIKNTLAPSSNAFEIKDTNNNSKISINYANSEAAITLTGNNTPYELKTDSPSGTLAAVKNGFGINFGSRYGFEGYVGVGGLYPLYIETVGNPIVLCPSAGGGANLVQIGRRIYDNNPAVGAGIEIWTSTGNFYNYPALNVLKPGGESGSVFSVGASGNITSNLSSNKIGLALKLNSNQTEDAIQIKDSNNNTRFAFFAAVGAESKLSLTDQGGGFTYAFETFSGSGLIELKRNNTGVGIGIGTRYGTEGFVTALGVQPLVLQSVNSISLLPAAGGGTGLVRIGKDYLTSAANIGASVEIWTSTQNSENYPAFTIYKPGGFVSGSLFTVGTNGSITSALSSDAVGLSMKLASGQTQDAIKVLDNNNNLKFSVTGGNEPKIALTSSGSMTYELQTVTASGVISILRNDGVGVYLGSRYGSDGYLAPIGGSLVLSGGSSNNIVLMASPVGVGTVQIGRDYANNFAGVGASVQIWTSTNQGTTPALTVLKPGGSSGSVFSVAASGNIVSALSSDVIGLELKLASGQSQDAIRIKDENNNNIFSINASASQIKLADSFAIGVESYATPNSNTTAIGRFSTAIGSHSTSIGAYSNCTAANSIAIGFEAKSTFTSSSYGDSVAIGNYSIAECGSGTAIGMYAQAKGNWQFLGSTAIGYGAIANNGAIAIGMGALAENAGEVSIACRHPEFGNGNITFLPRASTETLTWRNIAKAQFYWTDSVTSTRKGAFRLQLADAETYKEVLDIRNTELNIKEVSVSIQTASGQTQNAFRIEDENNNLLTYFNNIGQLTFNGLANSTNRLAQINTTGTIIPFEEYVTNSTTINLLINNANWDGASYIGSAIAGTSKSQKYFDDDYFYIFKTDSTPVRIPLNPQVSGGSSENLWTPTQIATYFWYDANDSASVFLETGISQINDLSGNARHLTQITASEQPALTANSLNGFSAISFDGGDSLNNASVNISGIKFLIIVFRQSVSQSDFAGLIGGDFISTTSSQFISLRKELDSTLLIDSAIASTTYNIVAYKLEANNAALYVNGTLIGTDASYTAFSGGTLSLGGGGVVNLIGEVIEGVGFDYVPTNSVIDKLFGYLAHKLQVTSKLSGIHPYKVNPPTI